MSRQQTKRTSKLYEGLAEVFSEPITKYVITVTSIISSLVIIQAVVDGTRADGTFLSLADKQLAINFVEWFGVLYGFLLPTILVRVWEQFDEIDNVLDREADAVNILFGDLLLLHSHKKFKLDVLKSLQDYVRDVRKFLDKPTRPNMDAEIQSGNSTLKQIRSYYLEVFRQTRNKTNEKDVLIDELLEQLNNIIDHRGDRISLSTQRLFESLNFIAIVTSIIWLVPLYFLYFQNQQTGTELDLGVFGWLLIIAVTFLVIIILSIIDDLDKPFDGYWTVNKNSWKELAKDIKNELNNPGYAGRLQKRSIKSGFTKKNLKRTKN